MITLATIIFLILLIVDILVFYTTFAIKNVHLFDELKELFLKKNGVIFFVLNAVHSILIAWYLIDLNTIAFILTIFSTTIYLFPNAINAILEFRKKS